MIVIEELQSQYFQCGQAKQDKYEFQELEEQVKFIHDLLEDNSNDKVTICKNCRKTISKPVPNVTLCKKCLMYAKL
jgi:hypothetical protein